jgi:hypothetical protein
MKKIVLTFGLIAGAILVATMLLITLPFHDELGFDRGMIVGYTTMLVAFLLIYFGVRSYRDNVSGGAVGFGRAFAVGLLIGIVASACYVAAWEVYYFTMKPDILAQYQVHELEKARASGATAEAVAKQKAEMDSFAKLYENPAINAAVTFSEPLPVALIVSLVSAGMLSRRRRTSIGAGDTIAGPGTPVAR